MPTTPQYVTVAELVDSPLGLSLKDIPADGATGPGGVTAAQRHQALVDLIVRATSAVDVRCRQTLQATVDSEEKATDGRLAGVDADGYLWFHTDYNPALAVLSFGYGYPAVGGTRWVDVDPSDVQITGNRKNTLVYPGFFHRRGTPPLRVRARYLNGYPNTTLTGSSTVTAGSTALPVADLTGFLPGAQATVYDRAATETIVVAATWAPATGPGSLPLAAATLYAHSPVPRPAPPGGTAYEISVSALPPDIKTATLLICKWLVERRGTTSLVMSGTGVKTGVAAGQGSLPAEIDRTLGPYRRIV